MNEIVELFTNLDYALELLKSIEWYWVLLFAFLITFIENIFPPSPSDVLLLFMGSLVGLGNIDFISLLMSSTLGSILGFVLMYYIGKFFGEKIIESNKIPFINSESLEKPKLWFNKYGFYIIVANRFLSGTRAVISFFAGISHLPIYKTTILSSLSALLWNFILIYLGVIFSNNLGKVVEYINLYGKILFPLIIVLLLIFILKYIINIRKSK